MLEQHVGTDARCQATGAKPGEVTAEVFKDSVGIGSYRIDLHPSTGGDNYIDVGSLPFQIPLGALLPKRVENLLARLQEPRHDSHHQWLLPAAPGRVEHRRGGRGTGGVLPGQEVPAAPGAQGRRPAWQTSRSSLPGKGCR